MVRFQRLGHHGVITGIDLLASALHDLIVRIENFPGVFVHAEAVQDQGVEVRLKVTVIEAHVLEGAKELAAFEFFFDQVEGYLDF